jgi:uncharacterized damage-inducible protein DinB
MNKEYFIELLQYDKWANNEIGKVLCLSDEIPPKCKILFHHIAATTDLWFYRVNSGERLFKSLFEETDPETTLQLMFKAVERWIDLLNKNGIDLHSVIKYKNTKGNEYENTLHDILTHLMTHNHYHRGQINQLLRQNDFEPAVTDYIFYKRM